MSCIKKNVKSRIKLWNVGSGLKMLLTWRRKTSKGSIFTVGSRPAGKGWEQVDNFDPKIVREIDAFLLGKPM